MQHDVLIVGGGPAGLYAGRLLAGAGLDVTLLEEHAEIGQPVHCTGILAARTFDAFDVPRESILGPLTRARFFAPSGLSIEHATPSEEALIVDRGVFDRSIARQAIEAGVQIRRGERVTDIAIGSDAARLTLRGGRQVTGRAVVLACGASYALHRRLGLGFPRAWLHSAQMELPAERGGHVELYFGRDVAPDGFGWVAPVTRQGRPAARVGVMTNRHARWHFHDLLARVAPDWGLTPSSGPPRQKVLPLGPVERTFRDRLVLIGDAAGLVKPTTGGGIYYSLMTASLAADVLGEAIRAGDVSAGRLRRYEERWHAQLAGELEVQEQFRAIAQRLSDRQIDELFHLARVDGVMPIVRRTAKFNEHRGLILALLKHPPARRILFHALMGS